MLEFSRDEFEKVRELLEALLGKMEQAENIEDCLILVDGLLDTQKPDHYTFDRQPIERPVVASTDAGQAVPPGTYIGSGMVRSDGGYVEQRFPAPISVGANDTLEVTWRFTIPPINPNDTSHG